MWTRFVQFDLPYQAVKSYHILSSALQVAFVSALADPQLAPSCMPACLFDQHGIHNHVPCALCFVLGSLYVVLCTIFYSPILLLFFSIILILQYSIILSFFLMHYFLFYCSFKCIIPVARYSSYCE